MCAFESSSLLKVEEPIRRLHHWSIPKFPLHMNGLLKPWEQMGCLRDMHREEGRRRQCLYGQVEFNELRNQQKTLHLNFWFHQSLSLLRAIAGLWSICSVVPSSHKAPGPSISISRITASGTYKHPGDTTVKARWLLPREVHFLYFDVLLVGGTLLSLTSVLSFLWGFRLNDVLMDSHWLCPH